MEAAAPGEARGGRACGRGPRVRAAATTRCRRRRPARRPAAPASTCSRLANGQPAPHAGDPTRAGQACTRRRPPRRRPDSDRTRSRPSAAAGRNRGLVRIAPASKGQTWSILQLPAGPRPGVGQPLARGGLRALHESTGRRIAVGGFSDGATYALTLAVSNGDLFPAVMALSPGGRSSRRAGRRSPASSSRTARSTACCRSRSPATPSCRQLRTAGYPVTYRRFRGGHEASLATSTAAMRWFLGGAP